MLFVFDWDGTLSNSTEKIVSCMKSAASFLGLRELDDVDVREIIGLSLPVAVRQLYPDASECDRELLMAGYRREFIARDAQPSAFFEGALESLVELKARGYKLAVATGKSRAGLDRALRALDLQGLFDATRCADETASKPHPLMLHELLRELGRPAERAIMVGDTTFDMEMAQRAQVHRLAVSFGAHSIERLKKYQPLFCMDDYRQLLPFVETELEGKDV